MFLKKREVVRNGHEDEEWNNWDSFSLQFFLHLLSSLLREVLKHGE